MHIIIGTENPSKISATLMAFEHMFPGTEFTIAGMKAPSGVPDQPFGDATQQGAHNRAHYVEEFAKDLKAEYDFCVGLEGGLIKILDQWYAFGAACVIDKRGFTGQGSGSHYPIPNHMAEAVLKGEELGHVLKRITNNEHHAKDSGTIGFLTNRRILRNELLAHSVKMALVPFERQELWK